MGYTALTQYPTIARGQDTMTDDTAQVPATESPTPGAPAPRPASATAPPSPTSAQTTDYTFGPAHHTDPVWGPNLKGVHEWGRKGHGKVGELESKTRTYEQQ